MHSLRLILTKKRYFAPAFAFMSINLVNGTWAIYIPAITERLGMSKGDLGLAIFTMAIGSLLTVSMTPWVNDKLGAGKATAFGTLLLMVFTAGPYLATSYPGILLALFFLGGAQGFLDVSMNATVAQLEKDDRVTLMAAMHGFYSLGGVIAGMGTFLLGVFHAPIWHVATVVVIIALGNGLLYRQYLGVVTPAVEGQKRSLMGAGPLVFLGVMAFMIMGSEGAIVDWSGLYLEEIVAVPEFMVGAGFLGFSFSMTTGRFFGDHLSEKLGSEGVLALGAFLAFLGYLGVLHAGVWLSVAGFTGIGAGLSVMVPELFRMAGRTTAMAPNKAIALVAGFGYIGFLFGPVILGFTADQFGLVSSYYLLTAAVFLVALIAVFLFFQRGRR